MAELVTADNLSGESYLEKLQRLKALQDEAHRQHEKRLQLARKDYRHFAQYVIKDESSGKGITLAEIHLKWLEHITYAWSNGLHAVILAPYGSGKTSNIAVGIPLFLFGQDPSLRIILVSANDSIARERLVLVRQYIDNSEEYREVFPHVKPDADMGWCVPTDCIVECADGQFKQILDVVVGDKLFGLEKGNVSPVVVSHVSEIFVKQCVNVTLKSGRTFRAAEDHKVWNGFDWVGAGSLSVGDPFPIARGYFPKNEFCNHYEAFLAGYIVGDGNTTNRSVRFKNSESSVLNHFYSVVDKLGFTYTIRERTKPTISTDVTVTDNKQPKEKRGKPGRPKSRIRTLFEELGLYGKYSKEKFVPRKIASSYSASKAFLISYFICDGWVEDRGGFYRVGFGSISKQLLQDCQNILRRHGVPARINKVGLAWRLSASGIQAKKLGKILLEHGTLGIEKLIKLESLISLGHSKLAYTVSDKVFTGSVWEERSPTHNHQIEWDEILSVEKIGKLECIDLEIDSEFSNYLLDCGAVSHNTKGELYLQRSTYAKDASLSACGATSSGIGKRADIIILDDINDAKNTIHQPKMREVVWGNFTGVYLSRLEPGGKVLAIACLTGDSQVTTKDGTRTPINKLVVGQKILAMDTEKQIPVLTTVEAVIEQPPSKTIEVSTAFRSIRCTTDHPFLVKNPNGKFKWVKAEELTDSHKLVIPLPVEGDSGSPYSDDLCWLMGFLFGDGWVTSYVRKGKQPGVTSYCSCVALSIYPDLNKKVRQTFEQEIGGTLYETKFGYLRCDYVSSAKKLLDLGLVGKAKTKRVPAWVFSLPIKQKKLFLKGFFDADGCPGKLNPDRYSVRVANEHLLGDLKELAELCGVKSTNITKTVATIKPPNTKEAREFTSWNCQFTFLSQPYRVEKIESVSEPSTIEEITWDITTTEGNFVANGVCVHNTRWHSEDLVGKILEDEDMRDSYAFLIQRVTENFDGIECETIVPVKKKAEVVRHRAEFSELLKLYDGGVI